jgi:hypothetical protein
LSTLTCVLSLEHGLARTVPINKVRRSHKLSWQSNLDLVAQPVPDELALATACRDDRELAELLPLDPLGGVLGENQAVSEAVAHQGSSGAHPLLDPKDARTACTGPACTRSQARARARLPRTAPAPPHDVMVPTPRRKHHGRGAILPRLVLVAHQTCKDASLASTPLCSSTNTLGPRLGPFLISSRGFGPRCRPGPSSSPSMQSCWPHHQRSHQRLVLHSCPSHRWEGGRRKILGGPVKGGLNKKGQQKYKARCAARQGKTGNGK